MPKVLNERLVSLNETRTPYVHARVVLAEKPTSAKPGDEALIMADGSIEGFVGGSCAESTVRQQSLEVLGAGEAMLLRISPMPEPAQSGKKTVHNACLSGGTLEIFLEPILPSPLIAVLGESPISGSLMKIAPAAGFELREWSPEVDINGATAVVVASHGRDDEGMLLEAAVRAGVPYVGLVASRKRGTAVIEMLDLSHDQKALIHSPAGLDIGARTPDGVAISILAHIVQTMSSATKPETPKIVCDTAIDPVCGMSVAMIPESIHADFNDVTVWFCASGCLKAYSANPGAFVSS